MRFGLVRRLSMLVILGAFLCAGLGQPMAAADAAPMAATAGMSMPMEMTAMDMGDGGGMPMPCKSTLPNCVSGIGCIFMVAIPPARAPGTTPLVWSRVVYALAASSPTGLSFAPDLGPPIRA